MAEGLDYTAIAAFIAIAVTVIGILLSNRTTQKSNELLEYDMKLRQRPWMVQTKFDDKDDAGVNEDGDGVYVVISNKGTNPAYHLSEKSYIRSKEPPEDIFEKPEELTEYIHDSPDDYKDIGPGEYHSYPLVPGKDEEVQKILKEKKEFSILDGFLHIMI